MTVPAASSTVITRASASPTTVSPAWDAIQRWLLRAGAVLLPMVVFWDAFDRFTLPKLLAARLFAIACLVVLVARSATTGRWGWKRTALDLPLLAFLLSTLVSTALAVNRNTAIFGFYVRYEGLITILTYAGIFWLTVQLIPDDREARSLGRTMLVGASLVSVIAIYLARLRFGAGPETVVGNYVRALGTMGNPVELATFLAMLLPFAVSETIDSRSIEEAWLPAAGTIILAAGLLLSFTRAAWAAAVIGIVIVLLIRRPPWVALIAGGVALVMIAGVSIIVIGGRVGNSNALTEALGSRVVSTTTLSRGSVRARLTLWSESIQLIARRPLFGSGPDTFGLVYPSVSSGYAPFVDKAHNDLLQLAVTHGLAGVLAYYLLVATMVVQLWRNRTRRWIAGMFAGLLAYYVALQAEFSWVPAALPFWILAGTAFSAGAPRIELTRPFVITGRSVRIAITGLAVVVGLVLAYFAAVPDLYADVLFARSVHDVGIGARAAARQDAAWARAFNPHQSVYAMQAGDLAMDWQFGFRPGPDADVRAAQSAFQDAVQLGTNDPDAYRGLAVSDFALGDRRDAVVAAQRAVILNRFDRGSAAVLQMVSQAP